MATITAMTSSEIEQLFDRTLLGDYEDEGAWDAVSALQGHGNLEIFDIAAGWLKAKEPLKRARAAAILAQLREPVSEADTLQHPKWVFREEAFALVVEMLASEEEPLVLGDGIMALGHLYDEAGIPVIVSYKDHPVQDVRFSVACALGCFPNDPLAVSTLIQLTGDEDSDVGDWSVRVLKERVVEAASALLGLPDERPEWGAEDYGGALKERFGPADRRRMTSDA
jgi:HEAT repeat protein